MTLDEAWAALERAAATHNRRRKVKLHYGLTRQFGFDGKLHCYRAWIGSGEEAAGYGDSPVAAIEDALAKLGAH